MQGTGDRLPTAAPAATTAAASAAATAATTAATATAATAAAIAATAAGRHLLSFAARATISAARRWGEALLLEELLLPFGKGKLIVAIAAN